MGGVTHTVKSDSHPHEKQRAALCSTALKRETLRSKQPSSSGGFIASLSRFHCSFCKGDILVVDILIVCVWHVLG